ncbi:MAG: hypothetical protein LC792_27975 [Actinobacteria bacterium]|nr:hypothetical protein [Actinomycetota bacterium]
MAAGLAWRVAERDRWGGAPFVVAVLAAAGLSNRTDRPQWDAMVAVGALLTLLAGVGAARLLADPVVHWGWVATGALISAAGIWAGVPETGPAVVVGGALTGLVTTAALTRASWAPSAGVGVAAVLGWAAQSGAAGRPWASIGGALCTGMAPWLAIRPVLPRLSRSPGAGPWFLGAHIALAVVAARWIAVVPHAGWHRVAAVAVAGLAVATATRPRA